jgi:galactokinase
VSQARQLAERRFTEEFGAQPEIVVRAPGRVNLLGGHVDYNDGWVLPGAIDRAVWLVGARLPEPELRTVSLDFPSGRCISLDPPLDPPGTDGRDRSDWTEYPSGVAWALAGDGHRLPGLAAVVASDLPVGAGVSSSAALEVAFFLAWRELGGLDLDRVRMAQLGRQVENDYLDVQSGIMDQFASLHGGRDQLVYLDCRTLAWERLPLPPGTSILVVDSGVRRRLVDGAINDRRSECEDALARLRREDPGLKALRDLTPDRLDTAVDSLDPRLGRRVRHVVEECARVRRGGEILRAGGSAADLGDLMLDSHASSRDLYEVSIDELDLIVETAASASGCHGARLSGAGFGGCATALVDESASADVAELIEAAFERRFGQRPTVHHCAIDDGAAVVSSRRAT